MKDATKHYFTGTTTLHSNDQRGLANAPKQAAVAPQMAMACCPRRPYKAFPRSAAYAQKGRYFEGDDVQGNFGFWSRQGGAYADWLSRPGRSSSARCGRQS